MPAPRDTIFALSSGHGRAGVAVIRMSGPAAGRALDGLAPPRPKPRLAAFRRVRDPASGDLIDEALVLWLPGPRTETGEDMAEFHVHGSPAVIRAMTHVLHQQPSCRLAESGEFARRAFLGGKLDLTAVEGLGDLIDADTEAQRRQALRQLGGALAAACGRWRAELIEALALTEAGLDFLDEGDVPADVAARARSSAAAVAGEIAAMLDDGGRGEIVRDGFRVVIAGAPNAGKSSLLNALVRRDAAIVSDEPGTTRDLIEVRLDLAGYPVVLTDTAGIRATEGPVGGAVDDGVGGAVDDGVGGAVVGSVEREGIRRTFASARDADLVLWLIDATAPIAAPPPELAGLGDRLLHVLNKVDLLSWNSDLLPPPLRGMAGAGGSPERDLYVSDSPSPPAPPRKGEGGRLPISALTGAGFDALIAHITTRVRDRIGEREQPLITRARHRQQLEACRAALERFAAGPPTEPELRAEDLRQAVHALGRITGRVDVEDVLDSLFAGFCIGK